MHSNSLNPLKHPTPINPADERIVALAAVSLAIRHAQNARRALLERHKPRAEACASQAIKALGALSRPQGRG